MSYLKSKFNMCSLDLPLRLELTEGEFVDKLKTKKFTEIGAAQEFAHGWCHVRDLFSGFEFGDCIASNYIVGGYRYDKKTIPSALLKKLYKEKIIERRKEVGKLSKDDKKEIKEECKNQLLMKTLAKPSLVTWIFDRDNNRLYFDSNSKKVIGTFCDLFGETFDVKPTLDDFGIAEDDIPGFLDYLWENLPKESEASEDQVYWIDREISLDSDKNTFKFNGPTIAEYLSDINDFKKMKKIKTLSFGIKVKEFEYSIKMSNKNFILNVDCALPYKHEDDEAAILDNMDHIENIRTEVSKLVDGFME